MSIALFAETSESYSANYMPFSEIKVFYVHSRYRDYMINRFYTKLEYARDIVHVGQVTKITVILPIFTRQ